MQRTNSFLPMAVLLVLATVLFGSLAFGQQLTGTLSGTAYDQAGAVVPNAKIEIVNEASGDVRRTVTNSSGYFTVTALQPGTYTVNVIATGFQKYSQKGVSVNQGDVKTVPNIALKVGSLQEQIEVVASGEAVVVADSGEVSQTLNRQMVNDIALAGRDAGELLKFMPGMAMNGGLNNISTFSDRVVSSNTGPVGAYSSNGTQPNGAMSFMLDGANLVDPGNVGTQIANVNADMTAEVKVLMGSYSAEFAKGPVVFQAFGKSGGKDFHGEGYGYFRNGVLNSLDSAQKNLGATRELMPAEHYYYFGGNVGGPVLLPFTKFNRNRNKLFFWFGYEYMNQAPVGSINSYIVPTDAMLGGNFSPAQLSQFQGTNAGSQWNQGISNVSGNSNNNLAIVGGVIPSNQIDPNGLKMLKLLPRPNVDPASHNGFNYQFVNPGGPQGSNFLIATNRWEQSEKVDYAINDNTKLTVSYTYQKETDLHPIATWWAPSQAVPYPSAMPALTPSKVLMANFTHVFSPSLVNEAVFTWAQYGNQLTLANPSAADPSSLGITAGGLFGVKEKQIPNTLSWGSGLPEFMPQADFYAAGAGNFGAIKSDPAVYDNVTKVWGTHTLKFGAYWDQNRNNQSSLLNNGGVQGMYDFETWYGASTGNTVADELTGITAQYGQSNNGHYQLIQYHQISGYAQDSWKASKRLTINYGVRFDHVGNYYDPQSPGFYTWNPAAYVNKPCNGDCKAAGVFNTGLQTHADNSKIPVSGLVSKWAFPLPRVGVAYDVFGNGKTVLRGGLAIFKYQSGVNAPSNTDGASGGSFWYASPAFIGISSVTNLSGLPTGQGALNGGNVTAMMMGDDKVPTTANWNFTISQAAPWRSVFEASYVGNKSYDLLKYGTSGLNNANQIPPGSFFKPDPVTGAIPCVVGQVCNNLNANDYYPLLNYQNITLISHGSYSNYHSAQFAWTKNTGNLMTMFNYSFSKVLGVRDGYSGNGAGAGTIIDTFNFDKNYGVLAYDHTHILNLVYIYKLPKLVNDNAFLKGLINGWQLSGNSQYQSGAPIQPNTNGQLNANWPNFVNNSSYFGTNQIPLITPLVTCDPRKGLAPGQYFNPNCFTIPPAGQQGTVIWPYIKGPGFFNSDLSIFKAFHISEAKRIEFRVQAFNFLNHANKQFQGGGQNQDIRLDFTRNNDSSQASWVNTNRNTTGFPKYAVGNRNVEFALKFYF